MIVENLLGNVAAAIVFALLGILLFVAGFVLVDRLTPGDLWEEVVDKRNVALAILVGAYALGLSLIIAASIH